MTCSRRRRHQQLQRHINEHNITFCAMSWRRERRQHQCTMSAKFPASDMERRVLDRWETDDADEDESNPNSNAARMKLFVQESDGCCC